MRMTIGLTPLPNRIEAMMYLSPMDASNFANLFVSGHTSSFSKRCQSAEYFASPGRHSGLGQSTHPSVQVSQCSWLANSRRFRGGNMPSLESTSGIQSFRGAVGARACSDSSIVTTVNPYLLAATINHGSAIALPPGLGAMPL